MCVEAISVAEKLTEVGMVVVAENVMVVEEVEGQKQCDRWGEVAV